MREKIEQLQTKLEVFDKTKDMSGDEVLAYLRSETAQQEIPEKTLSELIEIQEFHNQLNGMSTAQAVAYLNSEEATNAIPPETLNQLRGGYQFLDQLDKQAEEEKSKFIMDTIHNVLDGIGLAPGFGEPADLLNAVIYAIEGDKLNTGLSLAALLPFGGAGVTVGKHGTRVALETVETAAEKIAREAAEQTAKHSDDLKHILGRGDNLFPGYKKMEVDGKTFGFPDKSTPIGNGHIAGQPNVPTGKGSTDPAIIRGAQRENESATLLAEKGYYVEQQPRISPEEKKAFGIGEHRNPDYRINGEIFDNYSPTNSNPRNIAGGIEEKVSNTSRSGRPKLEGRQTENVVLNLKDSDITIEQLQRQFSEYPEMIQDLKNLIIIDQKGNIIPLITR